MAMREASDSEKLKEHASWVAFRARYAGGLERRDRAIWRPAICDVAIRFKSLAIWRLRFAIRDLMAVCDLLHVGCDLGSCEFKSLAF